MSGSHAPDGGAPVTVVVTLRGQLDDGVQDEVHALLETLVDLPQPVSIDVSGAWCSSGTALRALLHFREARRAAGRCCRLCGLHTDIATDLDDADLAEVFAVWTDTVHDDDRLKTAR